jgi:hypothetical protein
VAIEFEYRSSGVLKHTDPSGCDLVVCWENDAVSLPVKVLALRDFVENLIGIALPRPAAPTVDELLDQYHVVADRRALFWAVDAQLRELEHVSVIMGRYFVKYCVAKDNLAWISFADTTIRVDLFTGGMPFAGERHSKAANHKPFYLRYQHDLPAVSDAIRESYRRLMEARDAGLPRGYYGSATWKQ